MDYQDELVFLQINRDLKIQGSTIKKGQDLPLFKSRMIHNLKDKKWEHTIPFIEFLMGMVLCYTLDKDLAISRGYDKLLQTSPYQGQILAKIMTSTWDLKAKEDFLTSLEDLNIKKEDIHYLKTTIEEGKIRKSDLRGAELERALIPIIKAYNQVGPQSDFYGQSFLSISGLYAGIGQYIKARHYAKEALLKEMPEEIKNQARQAIAELEDYANMEAVESYLNVQDLDRAKKHLSMVSSQYPNPDHIDYFLANIALEEGNFEEAKNHLLKAINHADQGLYQEKLAFTYTQLGQVQEAIEAYLKALEKGSDSYPIHHNLAYLYGSQNLKEAIYHAKAAYNLQNTPELEKFINKLEKELDE